MSKTLTIRMEDELYKNLSAVSKEMDRDKTFILKKALEKYIEEYSDYQMALDRLNDKDDKIISSSEMGKRLGIKI
jgi:RHH-type transcriptional regulator, rel operon repressor / antitoxin RelB